MEYLRQKSESAVTKITFYKLANTAPMLKFVCQLIKKACNANQQVLCLVDDDRPLNN